MLWCDSHEWCCKFLDHGCTSSRTRKNIASGLHIASVHPLNCTSMSLAWTGPVPTPLFLRIGHRARSANWSMRIWQRFVLSILTVCHLLVRIFRLCSHLHITCQSVRICEPNVLASLPQCCCKKWQCPVDYPAMDTQKDVQSWCLDRFQQKGPMRNKPKLINKQGWDVTSGSEQWERYDDNNATNENTLTTKTSGTSKLSGATNTPAIPVALLAAEFGRKDQLVVRWVGRVGDDCLHLHIGDPGFVGHINHHEHCHGLCPHSTFCTPSLDPLLRHCVELLCEVLRCHAMDSTQSAHHKRLVGCFAWIRCSQKKLLSDIPELDLGSSLLLLALLLAGIVPARQLSKPLAVHWPFMADQRRQSICTSLTAEVHATLEGQFLRHQDSPETWHATCHRLPDLVARCAEVLVQLVLQQRVDWRCVASLGHLGAPFLHSGILGAQNMGANVLRQHETSDVFTHKHMLLWARLV